MPVEPSLSISIVQGTVAFSAGLHAWAFSIPQFAKTYAAKTSTPYEKWVDRLWGEHFLDVKTGKWQKSKSNDNVRGFVKFIYEPIYNIIQAAMNDQKDKLWAMTDKLGVTAKLSAQDKDLTAKPLMKRVMQVLILYIPASFTRYIMLFACCSVPALVCRSGSRVQSRPCRFYVRFCWYSCARSSSTPAYHIITIFLSFFANPQGCLRIFTVHVVCMRELILPPFFRSLSLYKKES